MEPQRHPVDTVPPPWQLLAGGLQHIAAMVAGVVAPPLIIGAAVGLGGRDQALLITASLFSAGLATLLQALGWWRFGARLPLINGASFAAVAPVLAIVKSSVPGAALPTVYGAALFVGMTPTVAPGFYAGMPELVVTIMGSGISAGCVTAIVLNQVFHLRARRAVAT
ncbi:solute carrier family 23 protein [Nocardia sp. NPDC051570]|uniref:solute carrier family 23 protein n=1 Tax=Nocardia sp. NPDC051570 TaxID=3364324 RepID=UPI0037B7A0C3